MYLCITECVMKEPHTYILLHKSTETEQLSLTKKMCARVCVVEKTYSYILLEISHIPWILDHHFPHMNHSMNTPMIHPYEYSWIIPWILDHHFPHMNHSMNTPMIHPMNTHSMNTPMIHFPLWILMIHSMNTHDSSHHPMSHRRTTYRK